MFVWESKDVKGLLKGKGCATRDHLNTGTRCTVKIGNANTFGCALHLQVKSYSVNQLDVVSLEVFAVDRLLQPERIGKLVEVL